MNQAFVVHHNPNRGRYRYRADPDDAVASAQALIDQGDSTWVAGNCRRKVQVGDLLLFKFGGTRLRQEPGIYAAGHVTRAPVQNRSGTWVFGYRPESKSGQVVGTCDVVAVVGPLTLAELRQNMRRTGFRPKRLPYPTTYAWVLCDARRLANPVAYRHPMGAVIWVRLASSVVRRLP